MTLPGAPPPLAPLPPTDRSITSPHQGDKNDPLRTAIMALQHAAELESDGKDIQTIQKAIVIVQGVLANNASDADAAMGVTPALRHVRRVQAGGNF
jgi:hypothetical protein